MPFPSSRRITRGRPARRRLAALGTAAVLAAGGVLAASAPATAATGDRVDLRALVVDDGSVWVKGVSDEFTLEGVPFTTVRLADTTRPVIDAAFLATGTEARYDAVILPDDLGGGLPAAELAALATYEARFGVRQVDGYQWANPTVGLNYAASPNGFAGDVTGLTATVTPEAKAGGFGYLSGTFPVGVGTYAFVATPAGTGVMPAGGTFTPFVTLPIPGSSTPGSLVGVYANGGVEKLVVTGAMMTTLSHFRIMAHGIVSWVTRGIHFGYDRNYFTFHFDDAFSYDARWDATNHCTPGEDCPASVTSTTPDIRMTASDVSQVLAWQQANGYTVTLPFNAYYSLNNADEQPWNGTDGLTNAFVANKGAFRWLNHGYQHLFQGCVQNFTVVPWVCTLTSGTAPAADGSNVQWTPQATITSEITNNITQGNALGLPFDAKEYLSGEHSGLYLVPQQPVDNPQFAAALSATGVRFIGADASREAGARVVGGATTVPRHPVAVYYNVSTVAEEAAEYNWFYTSRTAGGSGYCDDNPATATCLAAPVDATTGFANSIVPSDASNDLRFVLSNDPRPFYAHVSNLTGPDYLGLQLMTSILAQYRAAFSTTAPPVNLTLTEASDVLSKQQSWAAAGMGASPSVTGYVQDGVVTVTNTGSAAAPVTVPAGTTVNGAAFGSAYGGELSGWVAGSTTLSTPGALPPATVPAFTSAATASGAVGTALTFAVTTSGSPAATVTETGALPAGLTFTAGTNGTATLAGTPTVGGSYPVTLTATNAAGTATQAFTLVVGQLPVITSTATATATVSTTFSKTLTATGYPVPTMTVTGLPAGLVFTANTSGGGTIARTPTGPGGTFTVTVKATNSVGTATQSLVLTVRQAPRFTSGGLYVATRGRAFTTTVTTAGFPAATITQTGALPAGVRFTALANGQATFSGTPTTRGIFMINLTAANGVGTVAQQTFLLTVL